MPRALPMPADERRAAIMAATEPLLEQHGRDVSTRQIAEAAGIAEGTIFRVFPSKDVLVDSVIEDALDPAIACAALFEIDHDADLEERLIGAVEVLQARMRRIVALFHALRVASDSRDNFRERQARDDAAISAALEMLIIADADRLRMSPPEAAGLLRSLTFAVSHPMLNRHHASPDLKPREIVEIFLYGVVRSAPRDKEFHPC